mgnify:CR=1 FL=1
MIVKESFSMEDTFELGRQFGAAAKEGAVFCLSGDLGTGKTVFTQGFAAGMEIDEPVNSPTFTIVQEYDSGRLPLYHFDVYRIGDVEEMDEIGCDDYFFGRGVCLVEWAELVKEIIPDNAVWITIRKDLNKGFDYRSITIEEKED